MQTIRHAVLGFVLAGLLDVSTAVAAPGVVFQISVAPQPHEELAGPCRYELVLLDPSRTIRGVWVTFDRGRDMLRYYGDPDVGAFARQRDLALLLAFHCRSKSSDGDISVDPAKGLGRTLFAALGQLAEASKHPELASAKVILLGFSGTGALVGRFAEYAPDRVLAVVAANPGHGDPVGVDTIRLSTGATSIPHMILTGSGDAVSGTQRPYEYFRRHFDRGAPWAFVVQNGTPHCCVINAKPLILRWLDQVAMQRVNRSSGFYASMGTQPSESENCPEPRPALVPPWCQSTKDTWGTRNWRIRTASVDTRPTAPRGMIPAGWFPSRALASEWLAFVKTVQHPVTSLP
jgi:pimeloyl-ACP methyl ester carboxylesterase